MSLRFLDSFDHYVTADLGKKWGTSFGTSGTMVIQAGAGRRGTSSLRFTSMNGTGGTQAVVIKAFENQTTWILGFSFFFTVIPAATSNICQFMDGSTTQVDMQFTSSGTIQPARGGAIIAGASTALSANVSYYLEFAVTIHPTAGSVIIRANGTTIYSATNVNTRNTANTWANTLWLGASAAWGRTSVVDFDDVYICDGAGAAPFNTFLGDCRVDTLLPNSDGTSQQWTPSTPGTHYTLVDETPPNTTDYVASSTVGHRDTYGMQDLAAMTGTIYGVQLNLAALKNDAGARSIKPLLLSGASEALGAATGLGTSLAYTLHVQTTDPATGVAWTESAVNAMQAGAEVA